VRAIADSVLLAATLMAASVGAQAPTRQVEARLDGIVARRPALEAGGSLILPSGVYARTSLTLAAGVASRDSGNAFVGRAELVSRFLLDPFRESPYGLSIGGGIGLTDVVQAARWRPYLAFVLDLETKRSGGWTPVVQVGLGDGLRLGLVLRTATERWR
jgi:hypothetical protein